MNDATFKVKPLVWIDAHHDYAEVKSIIGWLYVMRWNGVLCWRYPGDGGGESCDSIADGKAKAEAYYREKLMAALEPVK